MKTPHIIGISGKIGTGKYTVAKLINIICKNPDFSDATVEHFYHNGKFISNTWDVKKFAGKLKHIASILTGIPEYKFEDQEFKKALLGPEWGNTSTNTPLNSIEPFKDIEFNNLMSVREFLQKLGTEAMRKGLHDNTWVNALFASYYSGSRWIITDVRFENEADAIRSRKGLLIRMVRNNAEVNSDHPSEIGLDKYEFDVYLINNGTLQDLIPKVRELVNLYELNNNYEEFQSHNEGFF